MRKASLLAHMHQKQAQWENDTGDDESKILLLLGLVEVLLSYINDPEISKAVDDIPF